MVSASRTVKALSVDEKNEINRSAEWEIAL